MKLSKLRWRIVRVVGGVVVIVLSSCSLATPTPRAEVRLRIGSADSMQLIARDLASAYHQLHPYVTFQVTGGNSSTSLREYSAGLLDVALVSRSPGADELSHPPSRAVEIARDGIVVIVHPTNPIANLTREQLAKIFSGQVLKWSQVQVALPTGSDDAIQVVSREEGSGTRSVFEQAIMVGQRVTLTALVESSERDVLTYVAATPSAIGYAAFNIWNSNPQGRVPNIDNMAASLSTIQSSKYPLMRTLFLVVPTNATPEVNDFIDFALSPPGRKLIQNRMSPAR